MKRQQRVVWSKGMFLMPQHFQALTRYFEDEMIFRSCIYQFAPWGITDLKINMDALSSRKLQIVRCSGVMPDGLAFSMPDTERPPKGRNITKNTFPPEKEYLDVYLGVPEHQQDTQNIAPSGDFTSSDDEGNDNASVGAARDAIGKPEPSGMRFVAVPTPVVDDYEGEREEIEVCRTRFRLIFGSESTAGLSVLRIAQLVRTSEGGYAPSPKYVPPSLIIGASSYLMDDLLRPLLESLNLVSQELSSVRGEETPGVADFSGTDLRRFWVFDLVNRAVPELNHLCTIQHVRPEEIYRFLLRLAGALCTYTPDPQVSTMSSGMTKRLLGIPEYNALCTSTPDSPVSTASSDTTERPSRLLGFPGYDHDNLSSCFTSLVDSINSMLKSIAWPPSTCVPIPLRLTQGVLEGRIADPAHLRTGEFFLSVRTKPGDAEIVSRVPTHVKVCGSGRIYEVQRRALAGVDLRHTPVAPKGCRQMLGAEFFRLNQKGLAWQDIAETQDVRVVVLPGLSEATVELFVRLPQ